MGGSSAGSSGSSDAPTTRKHTVTQVRKTTLEKVRDFVQGGGVTGMVVRSVKGSMEKSKTRREANVEMGLGSDRIANYNTSGGDSDNRPTATNVGGRIVKVPSPTTSEISQSNATDVTYDERKTKSKGRSMTILTSAKGVRKDNDLILGKKSLLGRA